MSYDRDDQNYCSECGDKIDRGSAIITGMCEECAAEVEKNVSHETPVSDEIKAGAEAIAEVFEEKQITKQEEISVFLETLEDDLSNLLVTVGHLRKIVDGDSKVSGDDKFPLCSIVYNRLNKIHTYCNNYYFAS